MNTLFKYILSGSFAVFSLMCVLMVLVEVLGVDKKLASAIAFIVASVINYSLQYHFVYKSDGDHSKQGFRFLLVTLVGLGINTLLFAQLVKVITTYEFAQLLTIVVVFVFSFVMNTLFTFKEGETV